MKTTTTPMFLWAGFISKSKNRALTHAEVDEYGGEQGAANLLRIWCDRLDAVWERIKEYGTTGAWDYDVVETFGEYLRRNGLITVEYDAAVSRLIDLVLENIADDNPTRFAMWPHILRETINNVRED